MSVSSVDGWEEIGYENKGRYADNCKVGLDDPRKLSTFFNDNTVYFRERLWEMDGRSLNGRTAFCQMGEDGSAGAPDRQECSDACSQPESNQRDTSDVSAQKDGNEADKRDVTPQKDNNQADTANKLHGEYGGRLRARNGETKVDVFLDLSKGNTHVQGSLSVDTKGNVSADAELKQKF